ncbi:unnamed protein product [Bursaphelenchus okinawaensis]|uniref:Uncharacterized protein n=1 Tax=Bursaphelenchus okinawaensis TaxID=465554 RepID=A0A811KFZ5_9BILA|nr:unnamed protein product [Bursaphelenchus okinawaensis]CAG9101513.1 unnamed protein product [Bursaphelenchus okinawaensis]
MKTAVFGGASDGGANDPQHSIAPSLTFTPPAALSAGNSLHPRRSAASGGLPGSARQNRRTSRIQNVGSVLDQVIRFVVVFEVWFVLFG